MRFVQALDRQQRVTPVPCQKPGLATIYGVTRAECDQAVYAVTPDGRSYRAAAGVSLLLAVLSGAPVPLWGYQFPGMSVIAERAYGLVAANRSRLPGDRPYCEQFPEECGQRQNEEPHVASV